MPECAPYDWPQLLRVAVRPHYEPGRTRWRLQDGEKHRRGRIFGEAAIFSILCNTHHLYARSIRHLVIAAHCFGDGAKDLTRKLPIHYRDAWRVLIVMPCEGPA